MKFGVDEERMMKVRGLLPKAESGLVSADGAALFVVRPVFHDGQLIEIVFADIEYYAKPMGPLFCYVSRNRQDIAETPHWPEPEPSARL